MTASMGLPDLGVITVDEVCFFIRQVARASGLPVLVDGDTGYGEALNVMHMVRAFEEAGAAAHDSSGGFAAASDREILDWFGHVVRDEGVFCEPSSAASLAGLANARRDGLVPEGAEVVCVLTGNGLKDPDSAKTLPARVRTCAADADAFRRLLGAA